jgi:phosphonatase-like hydrolase
MPVKLVVFDMAGTTVIDKNFVALSFQNAFEKEGLTVSVKEINPLMGYEKRTAIQMMLEKKGVDFDDQMIDDIYNDFIGQMVDFYEYSPEAEPAPGAEELFQYLRENSVFVALNTGFPKAIADAIVNRFGWLERGLVDDYIASDEVERGRPYSYMIDRLMYRSGIDDPMLVAKVGDTAVDIEEGKNAGCSYIIAVTTGAYKGDQLKAIGPTHVVNSLSEIHEVLFNASVRYT